MTDLETHQTQADARELILEVIQTLGALLEEKDPFLKKHSERVANNSANFCEEYELVPADDVETIYFAGLLHDIGMVTVPIDTLKNPATLSETEIRRIKMHPISGEKILSNLSYLKDTLPSKAS